MVYSPEEIRQIVKRNFKSKIQSVTFQKGGSSSVTHKIENNNGDIYYFKENSNNHELELDLTKKLTKIGVRLPEVIAVDKNWMLMKAVMGINLNKIKDEKVLSKALKEAGEMVALINTLGLTGYGPLTTLNKGSYTSYLSYYQKLISKLPEKKQRLAREYVKRVDKAFLCHGDVYNSHIYSDKRGEVITIIDIDDVLGASCYYDLAEYDISHKRDEKIWKLFSAGYGKVLPLPDHNSNDLMIEEYLILFESYLYTLNDHPEQKANLAGKKAKLTYLEKLIW